MNSERAGHDSVSRIEQKYIKDQASKAWTSRIVYIPKFTNHLQGFFDIFDLPSFSAGGEQAIYEVEDSSTSEEAIITQKGKI
jgi:hypothetical protein